MHRTQLNQPGWDICLRGRNEQTMREVRPVEDNNDSEDLESDGVEWIDEVLGQPQKRVVPSKMDGQSRARKTNKQNHKGLSGITVALGCTSVVSFVVAVIVYTA
jgi:hypothetical protein